jgi:hypothetical protein
VTEAVARKRPFVGRPKKLARSGFTQTGFLGATSQFPVIGNSTLVVIVAIAVASIEVRKMSHSATFKEHYSRAINGTGGDRNVRSYNAAMDGEGDALKALNNVDGTIITVGPPNTVRIIHGLKDMGNTMSRPLSTILGHIGMGELAFVGIVNHVDALSSIEFDTPTEQEITACVTIEQIRALQGGGDTYEGTRVFIPIPFVQKAIIESGSTCPIRLILEVRKAYTEYVEKIGTEDPTIDEVDLHIEHLEKFLWGISKGEVAGTSLEIDPDDVEQQAFSRAYHSDRILQGGRVSFSGSAGSGAPLSGTTSGSTRRTGTTPNIGGGDRI